MESDISEIDDKLEIAKERLDNLEQEEYFEELGRKLNGKQTQDSSAVPEHGISRNDATDIQQISATTSSSFSTLAESPSPIHSESDYNTPAYQRFVIFYIHPYYYNEHLHPAGSNKLSLKPRMLKSSRLPRAGIFPCLPSKKPLPPASLLLYL